MTKEKPKVHIDSLCWGKIVVNGQRFTQVIIADNKVFERDSEKLHRLFGTSHRIGDWETEKLKIGKPEVIIIGSGQGGGLKVFPAVKEKLAPGGAQIKILLTSVAVSEFNRLISEGKRVNALIHTTC